MAKNPPGENVLNEYGTIEDHTKPCVANLQRHVRKTDSNLIEPDEILQIL